MTTTIKTGSTYGRLQVLAYDGKAGRHHKWKCRCECGVEKSFYQSNLVGGKSTSCGCRSAETVEKLRAGATKHGMSRTATYKSWTSMKERCLNSNTWNYAEYGGRGITICQRWLESFENFLTDMGECPDGMTLDRFPNNDGHYEPGNCRWATGSEQQNNKRTTRIIFALGRAMTLADWSKETGLSVDLIRNRIDGHGWTEEKALTTPRKIYRNSK